MQALFFAFHDVFVLLAFYAVLVDVGIRFMLYVTIVGLFINATIVVFDRIVEFAPPNKNLGRSCQCFCYTDIVTRSIIYLFDKLYPG